jgi:hypothetical protein
MRRDAADAVIVVQHFGGQQNDGHNMGIHAACKVAFKGQLQLRTLMLGVSDVLPPMTHNTAGKVLPKSTVEGKPKTKPFLNYNTPYFHGAARQPRSPIVTYGETHVLT